MKKLIKAIVILLLLMLIPLAPLITGQTGETRMGSVDFRAQPVKSIPAAPIVGFWSIVISAITLLLMITIVKLRAAANQNRAQALRIDAWRMAARALHHAYGMTHNTSDRQADARALYYKAADNDGITA